MNIQYRVILTIVSLAFALASWLPNGLSAADLKEGDAYIIEPGHDAWVVGDQPFTSVDWAPRAEEFATPAK